VRIVAPGVPDNFGSGPGPRNRNPNDTVLTALSNANQSVQTNTATQSSQTQTPTQQPKRDSFFDTFLSGQFPLELFDLGKLNIAPNSVISTVNELSTLNQQRATATYNGPVLAIINGSPAAGTYQNTWNFANRGGDTTIKIDGTSYGGRTGLVGNGPVFGGTLNSGPSGRSADVGGVFLSRPGNPAGQQVGGVIFSGPNNYNGVGVFSGTK
jgi:hypothetical protein